MAEDVEEHGDDCGHPECAAGKKRVEAAISAAIAALIEDKGISSYETIAVARALMLNALAALYDGGAPMARELVVDLLRDIVRAANPSADLLTAQLGDAPAVAAAITPTLDGQPKWTRSG